MLRITLLGLATVLAGLPLTAAEAVPNPLNFYIGAGVGDSIVRDTDVFGDQGSGERFGWKVMAGLRPIPWLGAEAEYLDFGSTHYGGSVLNPPGTPGNGNRAQAEAAFADGYLPIPLPNVDLFAKLGAAHLQAHSDFGGIVSHPLDNDYFAYGFGGQVHFGALAARLEYERINVTGMNGSYLSDPQLVSVSLNWTF